MKRLRPSHSPDKLAEIYAQPHDHHLYPDHEIRVRMTVELADYFVRDWRNESDNTRRIADLSCGNGYIALQLKALNDVFGPPIMGDFAPGYGYTGPIEETIDQIPMVDLFILSETLEHLDDPLGTLRKIRAKTSRLILSTPIDEPLSSMNEQHYWSWDTQGIATMLEDAGFGVSGSDGAILVKLELPTYYNFQLWGVK